ncbi:MAG: MFS transporter, partial [Pseudorhodobacter sp.]
MARATYPIGEAHLLPFWRRPIFLLVLMAAALPISFATWSALLNNFVIEAAGFTGVEIGWLHTVREIPGFLAIGVIAVLLVMREQILALVSLAMLGVATAVTAWYPSFGGLLFVTLISSIGFHYFETVNQSLQLQWIDKKRAPQVIGWLVAVGSGASLVAYGLLVLTWRSFDLSYNFVFMAAGLVTVAIVIFCALAFPQFEAPHPQNKTMVLRRRYWLYYALQFMSGARRQIFVVFAAFMMVERFGMDVQALTALFLVNYLANMLIAPVIGQWIARFGERRMLIVEYTGLALVFLFYAGLYVFDW